jgi:hypothetical protein
MAEQTHLHGVLVANQQQGCDANRYGVREVVQLMKELGFPDDAAAAFKQNAITGGDVLQLGEEDLSGDLQLSRLQVRPANGYLLE